jgi:hypothetical protein
VPCSNDRPTHACHQPRSQSQRCLRAANGSPLRLCTAGLRPAFLILRGTARRRSRSFRGAVPERPPSTTRHQPPHRPDRRFCLLGGRSFSSDINLTREARTKPRAKRGPQRRTRPNSRHSRGTACRARTPAKHTLAINRALQRRTRPDRPPSARLAARCHPEASDQDARPEGSLRSFARASATTTPRPHKLPLHRHPRRHHSCYI